MTTKRPYQIGDGLKLDKNTISVDESTIDHDGLSGYNYNEHIDWTNATEDFYTSGDFAIGGDAQVAAITQKVSQGNSFTIGQAIRLDSGSYVPADCTTPDNAEVVGIVIKRTGYDFTYAKAGYVELSLSSARLSSNTLYYLGESDGQLSTTKPTTEGYIVKPVLQTLTTGAIIFDYRGIEIENLVKDEDDMASDSAVHWATQQSIKAYTDAAEASAKAYTDDEISDYDSDTATLTNKTIDADDNTISNLEHGAELDAPVAGTGVTHGHISDSAQTIAGEKTFSTFPITPSAAPDADYEVANKKYVDDNAGGGSNAEDGAADGQLAYWDNTAGEYKHTETSEFVWDDTNKRIGLGNASPSVDLEISHNYDGANAVYLNNSTSGTNAAAIFNAHGASSSYGGSLGYYSAGHAVTEWQNKVALTSGGNTSGLNIVDQSTGNGIMFQVGGYANGDIVCNMETDKIQFREPLELAMNSGNASITLEGASDHMLYATAAPDAITMEHDDGNYFRCSPSGYNYINGVYTSMLASGNEVAIFTSGSVVINEDNADVDFTIKKPASGEVLDYDAGTDTLTITPTVLDFFGDIEASSVSTGTSDNDKLVTQGYVDDNAGGLDFLTAQVFS